MDYDTFGIPSNTLGPSLEGMSGSFNMSSDQGHTFSQQPNYMGFGTSQHAYMHESPQIQTLRERCVVLERQLLQRTIERNTIQALFDKLTEAVKEGKAPEVNARAGYQNNEKIRFWTHTSFNAYISSAEGLAKKESAASVTFLEDENGVTHTRAVIKLLRKDLKTVFRDLAIKGVAPKSWGKASASAKNIVRDHMEHNWPSLRLAENGWKLEHLASLDYPGWMRTNLNENGKLMSKDEDSELGSSRKRKAGVGKLEPEQTEKKLKLTVNDSYIPSNVEDLGNEIEELYTISPEPPELAASPPALIPTPPPSTPSIESTPIALEIPVETPPSPVSESPSPPSGLPAPTTPNLNGDPKPAIMSPEPSSEHGKEPSESTLISPASLKSVHTQAEVEGSVSTAESESAADRVAVNPLGMLSQSSLKIKLPALPPPARAEEVGKSGNTSARSKRKMRPGKSHTGYALCAWRWLTQVNTKGTSEEFQVYWKTHLSDLQREAYNAEAKALPDDAWSKDTYHEKLH